MNIFHEPTYNTHISDSVKNAVKQTLKDFNGMYNTDDVRGAMNDAIMNVLYKYLPAGVNMQDILSEIEIDDMIIKLDKLGFNDE